MSTPGVVPVLRRRSVLTGAAAFAAAALAGCTSTSDGRPTEQPTSPDPTSPDPTSSAGSAPATSGQNGAPDGAVVLAGTGNRMTPADASAAGTAVADFGVTLMRAAVKQGDNALISPYSVAAALGMAYLGADDAAAAGYAKVFGGTPTELAGMITAIDDAVTQAVAVSRTAAANDSQKREASIVSPANSLFVQRGLNLVPAYLDAVQTGYGAALYGVDYKSAPEAARKAINSWVDEKTHQLIPEILAPDSVTNDWRVALVNALYLKAVWQKEFTPPQDPEPFTTAAGSTVSVPLVQKSGPHNYAKETAWQAVTIPYLGGKLACTLIVPNAGSFDKVRAELTGKMLMQACSGQEKIVNIRMPEFKTTTSVELTDSLKAIGMEAAFTPNYSKMCTEEELELTKVIHQARIILDHKGTEAAAATVVAMGPTSAPTDKPIEFTVNRPYFYAIHDTTTKAPLFLGQVTDPKKQS